MVKYLPILPVTLNIKKDRGKGKPFKSYLYYFASIKVE